MNKQDWAKEPLKLFVDDCFVGIGDADGKTVMPLTQMFTKATAERFVACVNACQGVPTETLVNGHTYKELLEHDSHFV